MAIPLEELFDPAFLESLQHLRLIARRVPPGGRFAEHLSRDLGPGIEFRDFRPYVPGDDLRAVDWNIYRRLGRVFVRLYEELEDLLSESAWAEGDELVSVGDLVSKGPDSRGVIRLMQQIGGRAVRGNHDQHCQAGDGNQGVGQGTDTQIYPAPQEASR